MTNRTSEYFKIDKDTPLKDLILTDNQARDIYGTFHGLYTVNAEIRVLIPILERKLFEKRKQHELLGRIAINKERFKEGIQLIDFDKYFLDDGKKIYTLLRESCLNIIHNKPLIFNNKNNFSNQYPVFSYKKFEEINPINES